MGVRSELARLSGDGYIITGHLRHQPVHTHKTTQHTHNTPTTHAPSQHALTPHPHDPPPSPPPSPPQELELALNEITPEGAKAVAAAVAGKKHLSKCVGRSRGQRRVSSSPHPPEPQPASKRSRPQLISHSPTPHPTRLNLRENELESAGAATIARALPTLPALTALDLAANQIGRGGALAVARALVAGGRASFSQLVLDENYLTDDAAESVRDLAAAAFGGGGCVSLEELDGDAAEDEDDDEADAMEDSVGDDLAAALARGAKIA
jgi:hypothetical protein